MGEAFFLPDGNRFVATELTRGPWDAGTQHAGPPAALLGRAIQRFGARDDVQVVRVTFEILRPVPIASLEITSTLLRGGRSVELVGASLSSDGTEVMRATGVRIRTVDPPLDGEAAQMPPGRGHGSDRDAEAAPGAVPASAVAPAPAVAAVPASAVAVAPVPAGPEHGEPLRFFPTRHQTGYNTAMEWRFVDGAFLEPGPATVWMRMRHPLLPEEAPSPLERVLIAADSGNGVSSVLDWRRWLFINPDLTVYLHRPPVGEWVCLQARTTLEPAGLGLAESIVFDRTGPVARGLQSLFIAPRP
jgi:Acyl-CoA thioesterase C-terminal domain/Acyl-CoA thioesterase N-terminal domain